MRVASLLCHAVCHSQPHPQRHLTAPHLTPPRPLSPVHSMFYGNSVSPQRHYLADMKKGQVGCAAVPVGGLVV